MFPRIKNDAEYYNSLSKKYFAESATSHKNEKKLETIFDSLFPEAVAQKFSTKNTFGKITVFVKQDPTGSIFLNTSRRLVLFFQLQ